MYPYANILYSSPLLTIFNTSSFVTWLMKIHRWSKNHHPETKQLIEIEGNQRSSDSTFDVILTSSYAIVTSVLCHMASSSRHSYAAWRHYSLIRASKRICGRYAPRPLLTKYVDLSPWMALYVLARYHIPKYTYFIGLCISYIHKGL